MFQLHGAVFYFLRVFFIGAACISSDVPHVLCLSFVGWSCLVVWAAKLGEDVEALSLNRADEVVRSSDELNMRWSEVRFPNCQVGWGT